MLGGVFLSDIISGIGDFMTAMITNPVMLGLIAVIIAGVVGRFAVGLVKKFTKSGD